MSDLIERLRDTKFHGNTGIRAADQLEAQQVEIARLREALMSIAERPGDGVEYLPGHGDEVCSEARNMELMARKALEQKP